MPDCFLQAGRARPCPWPRSTGQGHGHKHKHKLDLTITRKDSTGTHVLDDYDLDLDEGDKLVLEVVNPTIPECDRYMPGDFSRLSSNNDPNDYRWVVDMQDEIHPSDLLELKGVRHPKEFRSTLLEVNNATFYTESLTKFEVEKVLQGGSNGSIFGKIANLVAAKIACNEGDGSGVRLRNADRNNGIFLEKFPKVEYEISFKNVRDEPGSPEDPNVRVERDSLKDEGDFPMFYGVLLAQSGREFDLRKIDRIDPLATVQRVCNRAELYNAYDLSQLASPLTKETGA